MNDIKFENNNCNDEKFCSFLAKLKKSQLIVNSEIEVFFFVQKSISKRSLACISQHSIFKSYPILCDSEVDNPLLTSWIKHEILLVVELYGMELSTSDAYKRKEKLETKRN